MVHADLIDAFNDCVDRLHAGQSLDECLRQYPHYADTLRTMLQTSAAVRRAEPELSAAARSRMRSRVMQAIPSVTPHARVRRSRLQNLTLLAAVLGMVLFAGALIVLLDREDEPVLQPVPLTATNTATVTPSSTPAPTFTATSSATAAPAVRATSVPTPTPRPTQTPTPALPPTVTETVTPAPCELAVEASSVNMRSGPGTGYSVVDYAFAGDVFPVVAQHTNGSWFEVEHAGGTVWIAASVGSLRGACDTLPVSTQTYRDGASGGDDTGAGVGGTGDDDSDDDNDDDSGGDDDDDNDDDDDDD